MTTDLILQRLKDLAVFFRLGRPLEATDDLINLLTNMMPQVTGKISATPLSIESIFSSILRCQEAEDWLGLADYLEYELSDFLKGLSSD